DDGSYLTISSDLRAVMDRLEGSKDPLISAAGDTTLLLNLFTRHRDALQKQGRVTFKVPEGATPQVDVDAGVSAATAWLKQETVRTGFSLSKVQDGQLTTSVAIEFNSKDTADTFKQRADEVARWLTNGMSQGPNGMERPGPGPGMGTPENKPPE